ncbi:hypothetical protein EAH79_02155 [Sphingomonas koreensis]|nr:hypothetical protein EAH79_02155 [Sphingomonas koreensis]
MTEVSTTSRVVAVDLRRAERSINLAARDTAQFLVTAFDATETHGLSPRFAQRTVKATVDALAALVDGQGHLAIRAHAYAERVGVELGLSADNWGEGAPKPPNVADGETVRQDW